MRIAGTEIKSDTERLIKQKQIFQELLISTKTIIE
jgi:hypothetical protein